MALYFVTMDLKPEVAPSMPVGGLARIVREAILPSLEALVPLGLEGRLVTGGYLLGEGQMVFVFEADSEEEVRQTLDELPLSVVAEEPEIRRMRSLGEMRASEES